MGELARPITIYWDLTPQPSILPDYAAICEQVAAIKPLQLHLLDVGRNLSDACHAILGHVRNTAIAVTLTTKAEALAPSAIDGLKSLGLRGLLLHAASLQELTALTTAVEAVKPKFAAGIAFEVTEGNWRELPKVAAYCLEHNIVSLILPMQRLYGNQVPFMLTADEQNELAGLLSGIDLSGIRLTIHDPFLWRAFHPSQPFPGGGCQAANTMLAIAPDGMVYPCPALPLALGNLADTTLKELTAGNGKRVFRAAVAGLPEACRWCPDQAGCHGGCRGRSLVLAGDMACPDPACGIEIHEKG
jgi:GeoRSP system SPASM domain protein